MNGTSGRWRRRLVRIVAVAAVLVLAAGLLAKYWLLPAVIASKIRTGLGDYWAGDVGVRSVTFRYGGPVDLHGLSLRDLDGSEWAHIETLSVHLRWDSPTQPVVTGLVADGVRLQAHVRDGRLVPPWRMPDEPSEPQPPSPYVDISFVEVHRLSLAVAGAQGPLYALENAAVSLRRTPGRWLLSASQLPAGDEGSMQLLAEIAEVGHGLRATLEIDHRFEPAATGDLLAALGLHSLQSLAGRLQAEVSFSGRPTSLAALNPRGYVSLLGARVVLGDGRVVEDIDLRADLSDGRVLANLSAALDPLRMEAQAVHELHLPAALALRDLRLRDDAGRDWLAAGGIDVAMDETTGRWQIDLRDVHGTVHFVHGRPDLPLSTAAPRATSRPDGARRPARLSLPAVTLHGGSITLRDAAGDAYAWSDIAADLSPTADGADIRLSVRQTPTDGTDAPPDIQLTGRIAGDSRDGQLTLDVDHHFATGQTAALARVLALEEVESWTGRLRGRVTLAGPLDDPGAWRRSGQLEWSDGRVAMVGQESIQDVQLATHLRATGEATSTVSGQWGRGRASIVVHHRPDGLPGRLTDVRLKDLEGRPWLDLDHAQLAFRSDDGGRVDVDVSVDNLLLRVPFHQGRLDLPLPTAATPAAAPQASQAAAPSRLRLGTLQLGNASLGVVGRDGRTFALDDLQIDLQRVPEGYQLAARSHEVNSEPAVVIRGNLSPGLSGGEAWVKLDRRFEADQIAHLLTVLGVDAVDAAAGTLRANLHLSAGAGEPLRTAGELSLGQGRLMIPGMLPVEAPLLHARFTGSEAIVSLRMVSPDGTLGIEQVRGNLDWLRPTAVSGLSFRGADETSAFDLERLELQWELRGDSRRVLTGIDADRATLSLRIENGRLQLPMPLGAEAQATAEPPEPDPHPQPPANDWMDDLRRLAVRDAQVLLTDGAGRSVSIDQVQMLLERRDDGWDVALTRHSGDERFSLHGAIADEKLTYDLSLRIESHPDPRQLGMLLQMLGTPFESASGRLAADVRFTGRLGDPAGVTPAGTLTLTDATLSTPHGTVLTDARLHGQFLPDGRGTASFAAEVCQGRLTGQVASVRGADGRVHSGLQAQLRGMDLGVLVSRLNPDARHASGQLDAEYRLQMVGLHAGASRGRGQVRLRQAELWEVPILSQLLGAGGLSRFDPLTVSDVETSFTTAGPVATFQRGRISNRLSALEATPGGTMNLQTGRVLVQVAFLPVRHLDRLLGREGLLPEEIGETLRGMNPTRVLVRGNAYDTASISVRTQVLPDVMDLDDQTRSLFRGMREGTGQLGREVRDVIDAIGRNGQPPQPGQRRRRDYDF